jgi:hypothetical protein
MQMTIVGQVKLPRLGPSIPMDGTYACGPLLTATTGGNPNNPMARNRPVSFIETLFDIGLTQRVVNKGKDTQAP